MTPGPFGKLYVTLLCPAVTVERPVMAEDGLGPTAYTVTERKALLPQALFAVTEMIAELKEAGTLMRAVLPLF